MLRYGFFKQNQIWIPLDPVPRILVSTSHHLKNTFKNLLFPELCHADLVLNAHCKLCSQIKLFIKKGLYLPPEGEVHFVRRLVTMTRMMTG